MFSWWNHLFADTPMAYWMGRAKQKSDFGHMRTAKAQISLRIRAVWSRHLLAAKIQTQSNRASEFRELVCSLFPNAILFYFYIIWHYRMYPWKANAEMILCACARLIWILRMLGDIFSLDALHTEIIRCIPLRPGLVIDPNMSGM